MITIIIINCFICIQNVWAKCTLLNGHVKYSNIDQNIYHAFNAKMLDETNIFLN